MAAPVLSAGGKGGRFRQRKISTKQTLQILKQSQLSDLDNADLQQRDVQEIETGVDKNEEDEEHLQKILKKSGISSTSEEYIPTPDASKVWEEAKKFYKGKFNQPDSYIKSSCQVEDYSGCLYNMDEQDEELLKELNKSRKGRGINEDEFESVMYSFEQFINEKQPFLITDPTQLLPFKEIKEGLQNVDKSSVDNIRKSLEKDLDIHPLVTTLDPTEIAKALPLKELLEKYGEEIYLHFKGRKIARHGKTIHPSLKFNQEDDNDPYSCFRQRQFRQQRKTRRADIQSSEKLVKLYLELKAIKELAFMVAQREKKRLLSIQAEHEIFELRCKVKKMKREIGIKDSDEDLVAHKKKKVAPPPPVVTEIKDKEDPNQKKDRKVLSKISVNANNHEKASSKQNATTIDDSAGPEQQTQQQSFQPYVKLPPSKIPDLELESVSQILKVKDTNVQNYVEEKLKKRKLQDSGYINLTDDPNSPYFDMAIQNQRVVNSEHIPYSSIASSLYDVKSYGLVDKMGSYIDKGVTPNGKDAILFNLVNREITEKQIPELYNLIYTSNVSTSEPKYTIRKRIGRYGQVFVDRKYMVKKPHDITDDFLTFPDNTSNSSDMSGDIEMLDCQNRFDDRWMYDRDDGITNTDLVNISEDPARLNKIANETQVIRFGGRLLAKAYESLRESYYNHWKLLQSRLESGRKRKIQTPDTQQKGVPVNRGNYNPGSTSNSQRKSQSSLSNPSHLQTSNKNTSDISKTNTQIKTEG